MVTDDERWRAAAALREANVYTLEGRQDDGSVVGWQVALMSDLAKAVGIDDSLGFDTLNRLADLIEPEKITGETSDGYHTFDELYDHRAKLFSVIVRDHRELAWKSALHHDGTMYDGMFIVGIETPGGQATYHYDVDPYWELFDCKELDRAPGWDGHTSHQAIDRITALEPSCDREALLALEREMRLKAKESEVYFAGIHPGEVVEYADRIREACGEVA